MKRLKKFTSYTEESCWRIKSVRTKENPGTVGVAGGGQGRFQSFLLVLEDGELQEG